MAKNKFISDLRKAYVDVLRKHGKLYHFDDDAAEMFNDKDNLAFTKREARIVNAVSAALHSSELFDIALKANDFDARTYFINKILSESTLTHKDLKKMPIDMLIAIANVKR